MTPPTRLGELARLFLRLGVTAFGGPAAHVAMMHDEVVRRRQWMTDERFVDLVGATNLIPGPNSTELAIYIGAERARWRGLVVAGVCFILPAALIVGVLAWSYDRYGTTPGFEAALYGIKPVVIAIVAHALWRLIPTAAKTPLLAGITIAAAGLYAVGVHELLVLAFAGLLVVVLAAARRGRVAASVFLPFLAVTDTSVFWVFLRIGSVLYGSGYVLLAFLNAEIVERHGWLTSQQLLDAVSVGQVTPGPVFTTATFIGYLVAGVSGAIAATVAIFLPSFVFVALLTRVVDRMRSSPVLGALLDGVNAAALGLMAAVSVELGRDAIVDLPTALVAVVAFGVVWRTRINSAWLIAGGALAGVVVTL